MSIRQHSGRKELIHVLIVSISDPSYYRNLIEFKYPMHEGKTKISALIIIFLTEDDFELISHLK